jgi:hypothetical protein
MADRNAEVGQDRRREIISRADYAKAIIQAQSEVEGNAPHAKAVWEVRQKSPPFAAGAKSREVAV